MLLYETFLSHRYVKIKVCDRRFCTPSTISGLNSRPIYFGNGFYFYLHVDVEPLKWANSICWRESNRVAISLFFWNTTCHLENGCCHFEVSYSLHFQGSIGLRTTSPHENSNRNHFHNIVDNLSNTHKKISFWVPTHRNAGVEQHETWAIVSTNCHHLKQHKLLKFRENYFGTIPWTTNWRTCTCMDKRSLDGNKHHILRKRMNVCWWYIMRKSS
jgi:hypothetical protein